MTKDELIQEMVDSGALKSPKLLEAFEKVDRADFVRPEKLKEAYEDYPLPIGNGATISEPSTVAFMLEKLQVKSGEKVLDVGSGSGWTTALLAKLAGEEGRVYGVEMASELVEFGQENLKKYNFKNADIIKAHNDTLGLPEHAPYDKILVSAAARQRPHKLVEQLKTGGRMIIPIESSIWKIDKISDEETEEEEFFGFSFVPLK